MRTSPRSWPSRLGEGATISLLGWVIQPRSLYKQIRNLSRRYGKPIVITENGIATSKDVKRVRYLFNHMLEVKEAMDDGHDVRGYFVWTLVDNYEWHHGYKAPFGLSRMDPLTEAAAPAPVGALLQGHHRNFEGSLDARRGLDSARASPGFIER